MRQVAYVFVNANDFTELPRPLTHKIIYIGGIGVRKPKKLNKVCRWEINFYAFLRKRPNLFRLTICQHVCSHSPLNLPHGIVPYVCKFDFCLFFPCPPSQLVEAIMLYHQNGRQIGIFKARLPLLYLHSPSVICESIRLFLQKWFCTAFWMYLFNFSVRHLFRPNYASWSSTNSLALFCLSFFNYRITCFENITSCYQNNC